MNLLFIFSMNKLLDKESDVTTAVDEVSERNEDVDKSIIFTIHYIRIKII